VTDAVDRALTAAFPDLSVAETTVPEGADHPGNRTVRVTFADGGTAYLKVATDGDTRRVVRDAAAAAYVRANASLRAPRVLAVDGDADPPYVATAPLSGESLLARQRATDEDGRAALVRTVGRTLARLHEPAFETAGRIVGGDADGLDLAETAWAAALRTSLDERTAMHFPDRFADLPERADALLADAAGALAGFEPALLHEDPNRGNVLLCDGEPPGLIDWETAVVGDPALSLARAESHHVDVADADADLRERLRAALYDGYRAVAGDLPAGYERRRPIYRVVTFLLTAQTFDLWAPEASEPTADLAAWVRREFDARLRAARRVL
jgi:aminoglycoside phosphotransferase (APT) family kinase protein